jgi:methylglutaconyl-CoA hydratase
MSVVKATKAGGVLTVTLCDIQNRNALGEELVSGLYDAIESANADAEIFAVVVTNAGDTFCAGANLKERLSQTAGAATTRRAIGLDQLFTMIQTSATPILGKIAGHALGGGVGLAACFDISVASEDVKFGFTEVRIGVTPAVISVVCLPKMRPGDAMEAFLRGNRFSGTKAAEYGLISRAVPAAELDRAIDDVLADLRKGGPKALGIAKRLVYEVPRMERQAAFKWTSKVSAECFASDEGQEGMAAFLAKRSAAWVK